MSENKADLLLPCPFCGGPAKYTSALSKGYRVECEHCLSQSGWGDYGYIVKNKWNTRAARAAPQPAAPLGGREEEIVRLIDVLRADEGDSVTILCDNPDFNGQPNCAIVCNGDWTGWVDRRFAADTVLDALSMAMTEKNLPVPQERGVDRAAIIEEAARVAESFDISSSGNGLRVGEGEKCIAEAIRALGKETGR